MSEPYRENSFTLSNTAVLFSRINDHHHHLTSEGLSEECAGRTGPLCHHNTAATLETAGQLGNHTVWQ